MLDYLADDLRFPLIDKAIRARGSVKDFTDWAGLHQQTYYRLQSIKSNPTKFVIDKVLDYTGLTYEEAFREKE